MKTTIHFGPLFILIIIPFIIFAQSNNVINIENPSYEGLPKHSTIAEGWDYCGFEGESPPDIQPGTFGVNNPPKDGNSYAGMVTRSNNTFENLKINLLEPTKKGQCYEWVFFMSQSKDYKSISRLTLENEMFVSPVNIIIYGVDKDGCENSETLARYDNIYQQEEWAKIKVRFKTEEVYESIMISVQSKNSNRPKNGHILLDYFHPIIELNCEEENSPTYHLPIKTDFLSFLDTLLSKEEKVKQLVNKIDFDFLYEHLYLEYQLYKISKKEYRYDNLYLDELIRLFPKDADEELVLLLKMKESKNLDALEKPSGTLKTEKNKKMDTVKDFSVFPDKRESNRIATINYIQKYIEQRSIESNVRILEWSEEDEKNYQKNEIESPHKAVSIFIKK
ncbi:MAG: hypothetical protein ACI94Y_001780 [Maribacter sp.]|jgi:hypothetical protein